MQKSFGVAKVLALMLGLTALATVPVHADTISYQNALVTLNVTSNNYVTVTITNTLSNSQVTSVGSNISGLYFDVTGYSGSGAALSSSSGQTTDIYSHLGFLQGIQSTGWVASNFGSGLTLCVICAGTQNQTAPEMTIVGGSGWGLYQNANGSINNNGPHNPFLVGTVSFTLYVPGVTADSQFSDVVVQFGTTATPPTEVPEPASLAFLLPSGATIFGAIGLRLRKSA
jgi:hypothetical protein